MSAEKVEDTRVSSTAPPPRRKSRPVANTVVAPRRGPSGGSSASVLGGANTDTTRCSSAAAPVTIAAAASTATATNPNPNPNPSATPASARSPALSAREEEASETTAATTPPELRQSGASHDGASASASASGDASYAASSASSKPNSSSRSSRGISRSRSNFCKPAPTTSTPNTTPPGADAGVAEGITPTSAEGGGTTRKRVSPSRVYSRPLNVISTNPTPTGSAGATQNALVAVTDDAATAVVPNRHPAPRRSATPPPPS